MVLCVKIFSLLIPALRGLSQNIETPGTANWQPGAFHDRPRGAGISGLTGQDKRGVFGNYAAPACGMFVMILPPAIPFLFYLSTTFVGCLKQLKCILYVPL